MALGLDFCWPSGTRHHPRRSRPPELIQNISKEKRRREQVVAFGLCCLLVLLPVGFSVAEAVDSQGKDKIVVGSSNFTEVMILGYMYSDLIESNTDIEVEERFNLNGGVVCFNAIQNGDIDMFVEYTGSILPNYLH